MGTVEEQMQRVKKVYEQKAPKRLENFKGVSVLSKYTAGEDIGGEFFDVFTKDNKIFMLMSACSSFLGSSSILQAFSEFKEKQQITKENEETFINNIRMDLKDINSDREDKVVNELFTCILDVNTMKLEGHSFGNFQLLCSGSQAIDMDKNDFCAVNEDARFEVILKRGERFILNSPGFIKNWNTKTPGFLIEELLMKKSLKSLGLLDEIYFQLKKDSSTGFLPYDASSIILEVQKNVIVQI